MKKILSLILFVIIIVVGSAAIFQKCNKSNPEDILSDFKEIEAYTTDVTYIIKNARGEITVKTSQWYDEDKGLKVDFGQDRSQVYKEDKIYVKEITTGRTYNMEKDFDQLYKLAFIPEISKLFVNDEEFRYYYKENRDNKYLVVEFNTLLDNENLTKEVLFIDTKNGVPLEGIIYDKRGNERAKILYSNFKKEHNIDEELFDIAKDTQQ